MPCSLPSVQCSNSLSYIDPLLSLLWFPISSGCCWFDSIIASTEIFLIALWPFFCGFVEVKGWEGWWCEIILIWVGGISHTSRYCHSVRKWKQIFIVDWKTFYDWVEELESIILPRCRASHLILCVQTSFFLFHHFTSLFSSHRRRVARDGWCTLLEARRLQGPGRRLSLPKENPERLWGWHGHHVSHCVLNVFAFAWVESRWQVKQSSVIVLFPRLNRWNTSVFLSNRPYSPAIPRIPCVSPETVLLDQVGWTPDV